MMNPLHVHERELRDLLDARARAVDQALRDKQQELEELNRKFGKLKEDFLVSPHYLLFIWHLTAVLIHGSTT
jgi:hypothetical protein